MNIYINALLLGLNVMVWGSWWAEGKHKNNWIVKWVGGFTLFVWAPLCLALILLQIFL